AYIVEQLAGLFAAGVDGILCLGAILHAGGALGLSNMPVQVRGLLDNDVHARLSGVGHLDVIADAALGSYIGDEPLHSLRVQARGIAHIGVAVGVGIGAGNVVHKFITVLDGHVTFLLARSGVATLRLFAPGGLFPS